MPALAYKVVPIVGLKKSERRAIVLLCCEHDSTLDAAAIFAELSTIRERELRSRFDFWIDGGVHDKWFHGWPNDAARKDCFVFKWKDKNQHHRFYGFLCHPRPQSNPRFQLCVLCSHARKNEWETDPREVDGVNTLRRNPGVVAAIQMVFPDAKAESKRWIN